MKTLIAYASKNGTTAKCAQLLADQIADSTVVDLSKQKPNIQEFDVIVVGGSICVGQLHKKTKQFINDNKDTLKNKQTAYFICCGFSDQQQQQFAQNVPSDLLDAALTYQCFGGELNVDTLKGFDKLVAKMVTKSSQGNQVAPPRILQKNIDDVAHQIKKLKNNT